MTVLYRATGLLRDVLREFKHEYLARLGEEDLNREIVLRIIDTEPEAGSADDEGSFRARLLDVVREADEEDPGDA